VDNGSYFTTAGKYGSMRCSDCGSLSRKRLAETKPETKKTLMRN